MGGQSSLSPGHACFWLKSEIARALRQCTGLTLPAHQHQESSTSSTAAVPLIEDKYLFPVATECMHALPCCEGEESASSSLLCTSPALSLFSLISLTFPTTQTTSTFSYSYSYSHSHWQQTASHSQAYSYDEHFHGHSQVYSYYYPRFRDQSQGHNDHYCCDGGGGDGCCC